MSISVQTMVANTRVQSGLRGNQYYTDDQIIALLSDGGSELYDIFTAANQKYVISPYNFTTSNGATNTDPTLGAVGPKVNLPSDFQQGHSMDIFPDTFQARTVRYLANWLNRNDSPGTSWALSTARSVVYAFIDKQIWFYPPQALPNAPMRLYYTPTWVPFAEKITRNVTMGVSDTAVDDSGSIGYVFNSSAPAGGFSAQDVGASITVTFAAPNTAYNCGSATITAVVNPLHVTINAGWPGGSFTGPASGTWSEIYQPLGTTDTLPNYMNPWSLYLQTHASIAIRTGMQKGTGELQDKLNALKARINEMLANRQEEPQQPPLSGDRYSQWGGFDWYTF